MTLRVNTEQMIHLMAFGLLFHIWWVEVMGQPVAEGAEVVKWIFVAAWLIFMEPVLTSAFEWVVKRYLSGESDA